MQPLYTLSARRLGRVQSEIPATMEECRCLGRFSVGTRSAPSSYILEIVCIQSNGSSIFTSKARCTLLFENQAGISAPRKSRCWQTFTVIVRWKIGDDCFYRRDAYIPRNAESFDPLNQFLQKQSLIQHAHIQGVIMSTSFLLFLGLAGSVAAQNFWFSLYINLLPLLYCKPCSHLSL